jgi:hypothetical protein
MSTLGSVDYITPSLNEHTLLTGSHFPEQHSSSLAQLKPSGRQSTGLVPQTP